VKKSYPAYSKLAKRSRKSARKSVPSLAQTEGIVGVTLAQSNHRHQGKNREGYLRFVDELGPEKILCFYDPPTRLEP